MTILSTVITIAIAFVIAVIGTKIEIPILREKAGQNIREEGLESHYSKAGTPSMGGISIVIATLIATIPSMIMGQVGGLSMTPVLLILIVFVGFGLVGFIDDYLKVIKKQNEGLKVKPKFALQIIICLLFAILCRVMTEGGTQVYFPGFNRWIDFGFMYIPFIVFVLLAMTNAANLADGLDGLAGGITAIVSLAFIAAGAIFKYMFSGTDPLEIPGMVFFAALCGGCLGFLVFNRNPARVFMGDTGSLALGGGVAAAAIVMKLEILLLIVGLIYVIEALSVVMQVSYFKATGGKRIFKMAPIHHHFEMCGMKEVQVVKMFWAFTFICGAVGVLLIFFTAGPVVV